MSRASWLRHRLRSGTLAACLLAAAGCAPAVRAPPPAPPAVAAERYVVDSAELVLRVYRDGPLKQLGHNHVIVSRAVGGAAEVPVGPGLAHFRVELPLESLGVDDSALRAAAGPEFAGEVPEADRNGTRRNMLGPALLDAARYPVIVVEGETSWPPAATGTARLWITVKGVARPLEVPVQVSLAGGELAARSDFTVTHAALGLTPFSVAMGAIRVREDIEARLTLTARRRNP